MTRPDRRVVLLGASVRALAQSAYQAGYEPIALDLFADADTRKIAVCEKLPLREYPDGFLKRVEPYTGLPCVYTGGLENHPHLVESIADRLQLWGNFGPGLVAVRDPMQLRTVASRAGVTTPIVASSPPTTKDNCRWLIKPRASGAGLGIRPYVAGAIPAGYYLQQFHPGDTWSALFLGAGAQTCLVGFSRQLHGETFARSAPFAYVGNIGPIEPDLNTRTKLTEFGVLCANDFSLRGWFNIDFLANDPPVILEINPRFSASVEIFERAFAGSMFDHHRLAASGEELPDPFGAGTVRPPLWGKAVLYAPNRLSLPATLTRTLVDDPRFADVPYITTEAMTFEAGEPIVTVLATGSHYDRVYHSLSKTAEQFFDRIAKR